MVIRLKNTKETLIVKAWGTVQCLFGRLIIWKERLSEYADVPKQAVAKNKAREGSDALASFVTEGSLQNEVSRE